MKRIERDGKLYGVYDNLATSEKGFKWYTENADAIQVARMYHDKVKEVKPHLHVYRPRSLDYTQECVILFKGKAEFSFYDNNKVFLDKVILNPGDLVVSFGGYHGLKVLEDNSLFFEIKNGPFPGNEIDKEFMDGSA